MTKKILITGGAGYIGSAITHTLCNLGHRILVIDDLSKGQEKYLNPQAEFFKVDLLDKENLNQLFIKNKIDCIIHCAAKKAAGESEEKPELYLENNVVGTINLLNLMLRHQVPKIIFSSTACVYQTDPKSIYRESDPLRPSNHYGFTKIKCEEMIQEFSRVKNLQYLIFRFFNVAGDVGLKFKEQDAQNIFPILSDALNQGATFKVFGNDYNTKDGTGLRDYIHLSDIIDAHIKGIDYQESTIFNLGSQQGTTIMELIKMFEKISKKKLNYQIITRRQGDVDACLADSNKAHKLLRWKAQQTLAQMVLDSYRTYQDDEG